MSDGAQEPCQPRANGMGGASGWPGWPHKALPSAQPQGRGPRWSVGRRRPVDTGAAWGWPGRLRLSLCSPRPPPGRERLGALCGRAAGGRPLCGAVGKSPGQPLTASQRQGLSWGLQDTLSRTSLPAGVGAGRLRRGPVRQALALQAPWPGRVTWVETLPPAVQLPGSEPRATQECPPPCPSGALPSDCPGPWPFGGLVSRRSCSGLCPHWADSGQAQG